MPMVTFLHAEGVWFCRGRLLGDGRRFSHIQFLAWARFLFRLGRGLALPFGLTGGLFLVLARRQSRSPLRLVRRGVVWCAVYDWSPSGRCVFVGGPPRSDDSRG